MIEMTIPVVTKTLNETMRMHWRVRRRYQKDLAWLVYLAAPRPIPKTLRRASVRIERHSLGTPDYDGLIGGTKCLVDCLLPQSARHKEGLGFVADDSPDAMHLDVVAIKVSKHADQKTVIRIEEIAS